MSCNAQPDCTVKGCRGENELRHFESWIDLTGHLDEETIVRLINYHAEIIDDYCKLVETREKRDAYHKKYTAKRKILLEVAEEMLARDEKLRAEKLAEERIAARAKGDS